MCNRLSEWFPRAMEEAARFVEPRGLAKDLGVDEGLQQGTEDGPVSLNPLTGCAEEGREEARVQENSLR